MQDKNSYTYTSLSEKERQEVLKIKNEYSVDTGDKSKLEELRRLNRKVKRPSLIVMIVLLVVGTLVFGLGLAMVLEWNMLLYGVIVGVIGVLTLCITYPTYQAMLQSRQAKYADKILEIAKELLEK